MVECKVLKLYLFSFINHGDFQEQCVNIIIKDIIGVINHKHIEVW